MNTEKTLVRYAVNVDRKLYFKIDKNLSKLKCIFNKI